MRVRIPPSPLLARPRRRPHDRGPLERNTIVTTRRRAQTLATTWDSTSTTSPSPASRDSSWSGGFRHIVRPRGPTERKRSTRLLDRALATQREQLAPTAVLDLPIASGTSASRTSTLQHGRLYFPSAHERRRARGREDVAARVVSGRTGRGAAADRITFWSCGPRRPAHRPADRRAHVGRDRRQLPRRGRGRGSAG